jgi:hypothetical protein
MEDTKSGEPQATTYRETHTMGPLYGLLMLGLLALYVVVTVGAIAKHKGSIAIWVGIVAFLLLAVLVNFWRLVFEITPTEVVFGFGFLKKRFPRQSVVYCEPYELEFSNYLGYGIRMGLDKTVAYNTRSGPGVKLAFEGVEKPYVVSVDEPAYVCKVLGIEE